VLPSHCRKPSGSGKSALTQRRNAARHLS